MFPTTLQLHDDVKIWKCFLQNWSVLKEIQLLDSATIGQWFPAFIFSFFWAKQAVAQTVELQVSLRLHDAHVTSLSYSIILILLAVSNTHDTMGSDMDSSNKS